MFMIGLVVGQLSIIIATIVTFVIVCMINKVNLHDIRGIADAIDTAIMFRDSRICVWQGKRLLDVVELEEK